MREIHFTTRFKKDYKRLQTQPRLLQRLHTAIDLLQRGQPLDRKYCDHALTGDWNGHRATGMAIVNVMSRRTGC